MLDYYSVEYSLFISCRQPIDITLTTDSTDQFWMLQALALAKSAADAGEVPVGAVIVSPSESTCLSTDAKERPGSGHNRVIRDHDPTAHAEIVALRQAAAATGNYRLPGCTLYVTLEPCAMCAGAIIQARLSRVVFATHDSRTGAGGSVFNILSNEKLNHRCEISSGVCAEASRDLLQKFFAERR